MKNRITLIPALLASLLISVAVHAQSAVSLQQQMGTESFRQSGLDKLSPAELNHLQQWLAAHATDLVVAVPASETASASVAASRSSQPATKRVARSAIVSPFVGQFKGWGPDSVIVLQNGQKWRVTDNSSLVVRPLENPEITVKPALSGSWLMKVHGYSKSARVEPAN